jgi:hypothetical protein
LLHDAIKNMIIIMVLIVTGNVNSNFMSYYYYTEYNESYILKSFA